MLTNRIGRWVCHTGIVDQDDRQNTAQLTFRMLTLLKKYLYHQSQY